MSKIDKLKELGELVKSGVVTQEEFEILKLEILKSNEGVDNNHDVSYNAQNSGKNKSTSRQEEIELLWFYDDIGKEILPPKIYSLDFENISESEIKILKPFLENKYLYAPSKFTNDEIRLAEKLFTNSKIDSFQINSNQKIINPNDNIDNKIRNELLTYERLIYLHCLPCGYQGYSGVLKRAEQWYFQWWFIIISIPFFIGPFLLMFKGFAIVTGSGRWLVKCPNCQNEYYVEGRATKS